MSKMGRKKSPVDGDQKDVKVICPDKVVERWQDEFSETEIDSM